MTISIMFLRRFGVLFLLVVATILPGCRQNGDAYNDPLTPEERAWLSEHDNKIVLGHDPDAEPIDYLDENGRFMGMAADYTALLEQKLRFTFDIVHVSPWAEQGERT